MKAKQVLSIFTIMTALLALGWWNSRSDEESIRVGIIQTASHLASLAKGVDYKDCGRRTAELAQLLILEKKTPSEIGTVDPENKIILVNCDIQKSLGIELPLSLQSRAIHVNTEGDLPCR